MVMTKAMMASEEDEVEDVKDQGETVIADTFSAERSVRGLGMQIH